MKTTYIANIDYSDENYVVQANNDTEALTKLTDYISKQGDNMELGELNTDNIVSVSCDPLMKTVKVTFEYSTEDWESIMDVRFTKLQGDMEDVIKID